MAKKKFSAGLTFVACLLALVIGFAAAFCAYTYIKRPKGGDVYVSGELQIHFMELGNKYTGDCTLIKIGDTDIYQRGVDLARLRKNVGMVFQRPNPLAMSVYDNIAYGPRTFGIKKRADLDAIVEKSLRGAAMWDEVKDRLNKSALGLSGGQQQRLCIARALAVEPQVLLMDEPTSALDPISTGKIEELCKELKNEITVIMVTHNMQQAFRIADYTAYFLLGEMVEMGDTQKIFTNPDDKRTEDYVNGRFG